MYSAAIPDGPGALIQPLFPASTSVIDALFKSAHTEERIACINPASVSDKGEFLN